MFHQGEVVDLYLKEHKVFIVIISGSMHMGTIISTIVAVELYLKGGWFLVGFGLALLNIIPLFLIPAISCEQDHSLEKASNSKFSEGDFTSEQDGRSEDRNISGLKRVAYYMPDLAVLLNNIMFNLLIFVLPARMVEFTGRDMNSAILYINFINVSSFISALVLGSLADRVVNVFTLIIMGNVLYFIGCIWAFGSTTKLLHFPYDFEIGSVLVGLGDAAVMNLAIMSKFVLFGKWGLPLQGLGARSTALNNLVWNISSAAGIILSGFTLTRGSEIPTLGIAVGTCFVVTVSLIVCKLVK